MADLIDSLIGYVKDIKPYHTKIYGVEVEYVVSDNINVTVTETLSMNIDLGLPTYQTLVSLAVAVGDDDGWDTRTYDEFKWDIIQTEADGFFIDAGGFEVFETDVDWNAPKTLIFDEKRYRTPTGFMDYAFVTMSETLRIEGQTITHDVKDDITFVNNPWDSPLDGIDVVEYGSNFIRTDNDYRHIFGSIPNFAFEIFASNFNDGFYTVQSVEYNAITNETKITINESGLSGQISDGLIRIGFYDAVEWDSDSITQVAQPAADVNAKSTICEGLVVTDGYGWDDPAVGWDATEDGDYIAPDFDFHNPIFFDKPMGFDDAYNILDAKSTLCDITEDIGWDGSKFDTIPWDADNFLPGFKWDEGEWDMTPWDSGVIFEPDALAPTGIVVFSPERMPVPNPRNISNLFSQTGANNTWVIDHNFGYYPVVRVYNSTNTEIQPLSVVHTSLNQVIISFTSPQTGIARVV